MATQHMSVTVTVTYDKSGKPTVKYDPTSIRSKLLNNFQFPKRAPYGTIKFKMSDSSEATFNKPSGPLPRITPELLDTGRTLKLECIFAEPGGIVPIVTQPVNLSFNRTSTGKTFIDDPQVGNDGTV